MYFHKRNAFTVVAHDMLGFNLMINMVDLPIVKHALAEITGSHTSIRLGFQFGLAESSISACNQGSRSF